MVARPVDTEHIDDLRQQQGGAIQHGAIDEIELTRQAVAPLDRFSQQPRLADTTWANQHHDALGRIGQHAGEEIAVDLQPGQYLGACYLSGPGELPMHAAMGMFKIFTVE